MNLLVITLHSILLGITMKMADLFNEHHMKWFKGDALLLGVLWGCYGSLLIINHAEIANLVLAMTLAFLIRLRLDYRNHAIASSIIIISFVWSQTPFAPLLFFIFFFIFLTSGNLRDYLGDVRRKKDWLYKINEPMWYYILPAAIYGLLTHHWQPLIVFTAYTLSYNLIKYGLFYLKIYDNL